VRPRTAYLLAGLTVLAGDAALSGFRPLAIAGGLPLALILPGLALSTLLFRDRARLVAAERIMLVPALSLGTLVLGGLLAWALGAPLHRATWLVVTGGVTLAALAAVVVRELRTPSGPDPVRGPRRPRLLGSVVPAVLAVLLLAGAVTLSLVSSIRSQDVRVTTLSVVPPGAGDAAGDRDVQVSASGLAGGGRYTLRVTVANGTATTPTTVTADARGAWSATLRLPADQRLTLALYRAGEAAALRTVILARATG
jgi:hypothetical protein